MKVFRNQMFLITVIDHPIRVKIIELLKENSMTVTDIYIKLRLEQSVASQHLALLRRADVVFKEKDGKYRYYHLNMERYNLLVDRLKKVA